MNGGENSTTVAPRRWLDLAASCIWVASELVRLVEDEGFALFNAVDLPAQSASDRAG